MRLYSDNKDYKLYQGNMLDMLEVIDKESVDSVITDPPYELNFMGKGWDNSGIAFQVDTWKKCFEVLKPGGYLLAFGGSRTFHRIACAIEDAGFEIRDTIMWLYGSGFPKSLNLGKALDRKNGVDNIQHKGEWNFEHGNMEEFWKRKKEYKKEEDKPLETELAKKWKGYGTALKPSFEPIIVARKPFKGSLVDNVIEYGVGGINIDECRVSFNGDKWKGHVTDNSYKFNITDEQKKAGTGNLEGYNMQPNEKGRFPANTILTYDETDFDEVCGGFPNTKSNGGTIRNKDFDKYNNSMMNNTNLNDTLTRGKTLYNAPCDSGSASRYFYCAKASKKDRDEGLDTFIEEKVNDGRQTPIDNAFQRGETLRKNTHPTVKPTELMQYLIRLVSPKGAIILDPFNGSGSTGKAVMYENKERNANYKYIGIELTPEYLPIAKARIEYVCKDEIESLKEIKEDIAEGQTNIFDFIGE